MIKRLYRIQVMDGKLNPDDPVILCIFVSQGFSASSKTFQRYLLSLS